MFTGPYFSLLGLFLVLGCGHEFTNVVYEHNISTEQGGGGVDGEHHVARYRLVHEHEFRDMQLYHYDMVCTVM